MAYPRRALRGYLSGFGTVTAQRFVATERGTVTAPAFSIAKSGDAEKGMYASATDSLVFSTAGAFRLYLAATGGSIANMNELDINATVLDINSTGGVSVDGAMTMESGRQLVIDSGTVGAPGLAIRGDLTMGLYSAGAGQLNASTAGVSRVSLTSGGLLVTGVVRGSTGFSFGSGTTVSPPVAGTALSGGGIVELNPTGGDVTMTATPTIAAAGYTGMSVVFINRHATNSVTLQDESALAGSNLKTSGAVDCVIGPGDTVIFVRGNVDSYWRQLTPVMALNA